MKCPWHGTEMKVVLYNFRTAPLHRCQKCTDNFCAAYRRISSNPSRLLKSVCKQYILPPVVMSERWP